MSKKYLTVLAALFCLTVFAANTQAGGDAAEVRRVEVVFVLDTTGSMANLIEGAKKKIWSIANAVIDQNEYAEIRMGLVGYRDLGDDYVTKHFPLTADIQSIYGHLLGFQADGGGDTPESVNEALDVALGKMGWSEPETEGVSRIIFLVGDAPPHMDYKQDRKYHVVVKEAVEKGIVVNSVQAGNMKSTRKYWQEIAKLGNGEYLAIPQDGGRVVIIETPFDETIHDIQTRLNETIIPYGSLSQKHAVEEKTRQYEARSSASADMASFVNKSGRGRNIITGAGDLVADSRDGLVDLEKIEPGELPEDLQNLSKDELNEKIREMEQKREALAQELAEQVIKRDAFIRTQEEKALKAAPAPANDSFDRSVKRTLDKQIK